MKTTATTTPQELDRVNKALKKKFLNKKLILGSGSVPAKLVFVTEIPGADEVRESRPLTGLSEKMLHQVLKTVGIDKKKIYITSVVKYSATPGKAISPKEIKSHIPFLKEEIKAINPSVVVTLGMTALNGIGLRQPLDNVHGRTFNFGSYELIPTFHPSHAVNDPQIKAHLTNDLSKLKELLKKPAENQ
ncbi:MAG: uracil-DNA glycosylase [Candidatus Pacebacteria bacterium]|nr:uracil-DNA glycosylase [Candidatus Paceibacterota bacterium]